MWRKDFDWFDHDKNRKLLWIVMYTVCAVTVVAEFFIKRKPHFHIEGYFGFFAVLGFLACAVSILVSKVLGYRLKVREDYYEDDHA